MIALYNSKTWKLSSYIMALVLVIPVLVMFFGGISASTQLFTHLWQTVLPTYLENTILLAFWVVLLSLIFGVLSAVIITQTNIIFSYRLIYLEPITVFINHICRIIVPLSLRLIIFNSIHASPTSGQVAGGGGRYKILY